MYYNYNINQIEHSFQDEKWGIYSTNTGHFSADQTSSESSIIDNHTNQYVTDRNRGRKVNEYQIVYITDGFGSYKSGEICKPINSGTIIFIFPDHRHRYFPEPDTRWKERWIGFKGEYPDILMKNRILDIHNPVIHIGYNESILDSYNTIQELAEEKDDGFQNKTSSCILNIINTICTIHNVEGNNHTQDYVIEKAKLFLHDNLYNTLDVESMSRQLSINYKTLIELFRVNTGMTPYQYFLHMKIMKAKEMLTIGNLSVKEISYKLEFQNPYYFSRLFKNKTGKSPSRWGSFTDETSSAEIE